MSNSTEQSKAEFLLQLKRQESDALRDILRSINQPSLKIDHLFQIAQNTVLAQLRVGKMAFFYRTEDGLKTGYNWGFPEFSEDLEDEFPEELGTIETNPDEHSELHAAGAEFVIPIQFRNSVGAWFAVGDFNTPAVTRNSDLIFIETIGNVLSSAVENRHLINELVQQESVRRELEVAEKIQQQLLITDFGHFKRADIHATNIPHRKVGGDYYDVVGLSGRGFIVVIADVAGKGIGAALLMANLQAALRALILSEDTLSNVILRLNESLMSVTGGEQFVTLFLAHVRPADGEMDYINAGHNYPYFVTEGKVVPLDAGSIPLGILEINSATQETVKIMDGDALFMYTDGLIDQPDSHGNLLGEEAVMRIVSNNHSRSAKEIVEAMQDLFSRFSEGQESVDDVTMLAVKFR